MNVARRDADLFVKDKLTPREQEVLAALACGLTVARAAERFGVRPSTVTTHVRRIYSKLYINSRAQAALAAQSLGLL